MNGNISCKERIEGANQILEQAIEAANALGIELDDVYWCEGIKDTHDKYTLKLKAKAGTTHVSMSREELEDYPGRIGGEKVEAKIRDALLEIKFKYV